uniref:Arrestin C-terminal-like domain-containing protein n=1 Tax=Daphnia galeata TaxID=27404 RepID=A0A8J2W7W7_9CRUS|nr:unnamed protein product [Daphnia galeata]
MDYIREFDIRLEKEMYYAGETVYGVVILDTSENFKLRAVRVVLRGRAHLEWKVVVSGDQQSISDDQYFIDERSTIWGKEKADGSIPVLPRGYHQFPFHFLLPESCLPCSFESKIGTVRYYIKATVDIPYASPPQGMKYFTIIGPHIDCMEEQYLKPLSRRRKRISCCLCCKKGPLSLSVQLDRSAYVSGESLRLKADIHNRSAEEVRLRLRLVQYVEYTIHRGVLGANKEVQHVVLEYRGDPVQPGRRSKFDSSQSLVLPALPTTLVGVCRMINVYYALHVSLLLESEAEDLTMEFPVTIATVPFRIPNSPNQPVVYYEPACEHVEGGRYVGPEFQLGQVYDGGPTTCEADVVLYRPVYVCVSSLRSHLKTGNNFAANCAKLTQQNSKDRSTLLAATASKVIASNSPVTKAAVSAAANAASSASGQHSTASQDS